MELNDAICIAEFAYAQPPRRMDAIRLLRSETNIGLIDANKYLQSTRSQDELLGKLCGDFVVSKHDQLQMLREELRQLLRRMAYLQKEIGEEADVLTEEGLQRLMKDIFNEPGKFTYDPT